MTNDGPDFQPQRRYPNKIVTVDCYAPQVLGEKIEERIAAEPPPAEYWSWHPIGIAMAPMMNSSVVVTILLEPRYEYSTAPIPPDAYKVRPT